VASKNPSPRKRTRRRGARPPERVSPEVERWLAAHDHPLRPVLLAVRQAILAVDPLIAEGIKWNAPSFHLREYFATAAIRGEGVVHVVLHRGAKARPLPNGGVTILDPGGLLEWHAADRASIRFRTRAEFQSGRAAFQEILRQWIRLI
jgi:hypothetical protein